MGQHFVPYEYFNRSLDTAAINRLYLLTHHSYSCITEKFTTRHPSSS